jgi:Fic family protein
MVRVAGRFGNPGRSYAKSHPWITFTFDFRSLSAIDFIHLGEALSKCDHIAGVPLPPDVAAQLHRIYLAKGVHATTQIEGNTLSEDEVQARVDGRLPLPESQEYLGREIDNIVATSDLIADDMAKGKDMGLTRQRIERFNAMVLDRLPVDDWVTPGKIRRRSVTVGGGIYRGAPAEDCTYLLDQLCDWLSQLDRDAPDEWRRPMRVVRAILAHVYLAWIHPFGDGNGRTARLIEFQLLADAGFPSPACHLLSNYYNRTRQVYYQVLRETSRSAPYRIEKFLSYALRGFVEELREQLRVVQGMQLGLVWMNFVHTADLGTGSETVKRRRELILALPTTPEFTPISAIRHLTPKLAERYATMTGKAVTRDVNALVQAGLLIAKGKAVRPNIEMMLSFLPLRSQSG